MSNVSPNGSMTSKERVLNLLARKPVDRVPCFSGMGNVTLAGIRDYGWEFSSLHTDPAKMATAAASTPKLYGYDCAVVPFDMGVEAQGLGCEVNYYEGLAQSPEEIYYPTIKTKYVKKAEDICRPQNGLESAGRFPVVLEAARRLKAELGETVPLGMWVLGPFTLAGQVVELDDLLKMPMKDPDGLQKILDALSDYLIDVLKMYRAAGADYLTVREMGATSDVLSPRMFRTLILPHLQKIFANLEGPKILHICGNTNKIIGAMNEAGADALSVEHRNDVRASRELLGPETVLLGNFNGYGLLVEATPETIQETVTASLDNGLNAIWPGCDIWPTAKPENVRALIETTHAYPPEKAGGRR
ncbi:MAG TPA: MtaA/CmuA family methyltransferase [Anaerolineales bacterium]|nr:MtaA/CmuA family methyltransferase [Anaerolineales bacterium]